MRRLAERWERLLRAGVAAAVLCCGAAAASAQSYDWIYPAGPHESGHLTVWIVLPQSGLRRTRSRASAQVNPAEYHEQTAGSSGQAADSRGQTAGTAGQTMGEFGQAAGSVGQAAGSTGQTAGSYRGNVSNGGNAGDAGRTMGEFGVSTSDLPRAAAAANTIRTRGADAKHDASWQKFTDLASGFLPGIEVRYVDVFDDALQQRLQATDGTEDYPDVLLGNPLPAAWSGSPLELRYGVLNLWFSTNPPQSETPRARIYRDYVWPQFSILADARNPQGARAFAVWLDGGVSLGTAAPPQSSDPASLVAVRAVRGLLSGEGPEPNADPEMAQLNAGSVAGAALARYGRGMPDALKLRFDAIAQQVNGRLAVVAVRALASAPQAFGTVHAAVVLRQDAAGRWRVLQISPFLTPQSQALALGPWDDAKSAVAPLDGEHAAVQGIAQAAPMDGETRSPQPELWWDNRGGATLQVVEWQRGASDWSYSNLYFVPDANSRLRTRVVARFAASPARYRWRVWSVAKDGTVVLSPWRTLNIVGR